MKLGMAIDLERCIGCRTCTTLCKDHNSQPEGIWWNRVFTIGADEHQVATPTVDGSFDMAFMPVACQMCENPSCVKVCPTGASYTDKDGVVLIDYERCIGCRYCFSACPYGVRQFNWGSSVEGKTMGKIDYIYGYPFDYRQDGQLVYTQNRPTGVAEKCTFCAQYRAEGELPACVKGCPGNARIFGDLDDPNSPISKHIGGRTTIRLEEDLGNEPKVIYIPSSQKHKPNTYDEVLEGGNQNV